MRNNHSYRGQVIILITFIFIVIGIICLSFKAHATEASCHQRAELVKMVKLNYERGREKVLVLSVYQDDTDHSRTMRQITHAIYRGEYDTVTATDMYNFVFYVCTTREDLNHE